MKVFIAGASGVLGRRVAKLLVDRGDEVVGLTMRRPQRIESIGAVPVVADAFDASQVLKAVEQAKPDAVINLLTRIPHAAVPSPRRLRENNDLRRIGTENLVAACQKVGVDRLLTESVTFAFFGRQEEKMRPLGSMGPYQAAIDAVVAMEAAILAFPGSVLRYGYFYGPDTSVSELLPKALKRLMVPIVGPGTGWLSFVHIDDAAAATVLALDRAKPREVYNICDDTPVLARDAYRSIAAASGAFPPLRLPKVGPYYVVQYFNDSTGANNSKAKHELGWEPMHPEFVEGFAKAWDLAHVGGGSGG